MSKSKKDSLVISKGTISSKQMTDKSTNICTWIALAEAFIIVILILILLTKRNRSKRVHNEIEEAKRSKVDFANTIRSAWEAKPLYDKLKKLCHPDRFPISEFPEKHQIATELATEVAKYQHNLQVLQKLEEEINQKLYK